MEPPPSLRRLLTAGRWLLLPLALALSLAAACAGWRDVFADNGDVFFVDADCYARMTRVRAICEHPGLIVRQHDFENFPIGVQSHTTAPLDYLIWALRGGLGWWRGGETRDLAGAWVSPLIGLAAVGGVGAWALGKKLPGAGLILAIVAGSPIVAHGFALGRPDHQSLVLACLAWALAAEWAQWGQPSRAWGIIGGAAWALGLWTSLYEPLILLAIVGLAGLVCHRRALWRRERLPGLAVAVAILLAAWWIEGWRIQGIPGSGGAGSALYFEAWTRQIGELSQAPPWSADFFGWTGLGLIVAPALLLLPRFRVDDAEEIEDRSDRRIAYAHCLLIVCVWWLTCWQRRWGYFLPLTYAMSLPWQLRPLSPRWRPTALGILAIGLWPMASAWRAQLHPDAATADYLAEQHADLVELRSTAEFIARASEVTVADTAGAAGTPGNYAGIKGILAPWWQCPALAYWSGQPAVAGSSHESLDGIVDTARFYLETDARRAADILRARRVRWIVVYDAHRMLDESSAPLLDRPVNPRCVGAILYKNYPLVPGFLRRVMDHHYFKVYEVLPATLPDP